MIANDFHCKLLLILHSALICDLQIAFNISRGIAGSALYYTVKVNNTDDSTCDAGSYEANVNINSCNKGFCIVVVFSGLIPLCSESSESANLMVTVTAINKLGQGLPSSYVTIGIYFINFY